MPEHPARSPLRPAERGILCDLALAGVMTTDQVWRLRFPGTGRANCRLRLARLRQRGLLARLALPGPGGRESCWCLTSAGLAATGGAGAAEPLWDLSDPWRLDALLQHAERYLQAALDERMRAAAGERPAAPPP